LVKVHSMQLQLQAANVSSSLPRFSIEDHLERRSSSFEECELNRPLEAIGHCYPLPNAMPAVVQDRGG